MSNLVVRTNLLAMNSHRNLGNVGRQQMQASARLSSGFRINSAADDAAGLGVSENMRAQISGLNQARRNALDGISLVQTAEGGLDVMTDMLRRIRELTVQAANDTYTYEMSENSLGQLYRTGSDRSRIQQEIDNLIAEIGRQTSTVQFNGRQLLDGSSFLEAARRNPATNSYWQGYQDAIEDFEDAREVFETARQDVEEARRTFNDLAAAGFATAADETSARDDLETAMQLFETARGDFELAFAELTEARQELEEAMRYYNVDSSIWLQVGANSGQRIHVTLPDINNTIFRQLEHMFLSRSISHQDGSFTVGNVELGNISNGTGEEITSIINEVDTILNSLVSLRADIGAIQNRLEFTVENLAIAAENLTEANSRIRDTDMAEEMMQLTKANILQQAATAMLAQANQAPQSILQLLG